MKAKAKKAPPRKMSFRKMSFLILEELKVYWDQSPGLTFGEVIENISAEAAHLAEDRDEEPAEEFVREADANVLAALAKLVRS